MIIDCHGHYTTAPGAHQKFRDAQIAALKDPTAPAAKPGAISADEIREIVARAFPEARIGYAVDVKRQGIVDSWPAAVDDSAARRDWGFAPAFDLSRAFSEYLIPTIRKQYQP